jgi:hypothetical protein
MAPGRIRRRELDVAFLAQTFSRGISNGNKLVPAASMSLPLSYNNMILDVIQFNFTVSSLLFYRKNSCFTARSNSVIRRAESEIIDLAPKRLDDERSNADNRGPDVACVRVK